MHGETRDVEWEVEGHDGRPWPFIGGLVKHPVEKLAAREDEQIPIGIWPGQVNRSVVVSAVVTDEGVALGICILHLVGMKDALLNAGQPPTFDHVAEPPAPEQQCLAGGKVGVRLRVEHQHVGGLLDRTIPRATRPGPPEQIGRRKGIGPNGDREPVAHLATDSNRSRALGSRSSTSRTQARSLPPLRRR